MSADKPVIKVFVVGLAGNGMTALAQLITEKIREAGFTDVVLNDDQQHSEEVQKRIFDKISNQVSVKVVKRFQVKQPNPKTIGRIV